MQRIDDRTVELTDDEILVSEIFDLLLDYGMCQRAAVDLIFGCQLPIDLRSQTPRLDSVMTADFVAYLLE